MTERTAAGHDREKGGREGAAPPRPHLFQAAHPAYGMGTGPPRTGARTSASPWPGERPRTMTLLPPAPSPRTPARSRAIVSHRASLTRRTRSGAMSGAASLALMLLPLLLGAADAPPEIVAQQGDVKLTAAQIRDLVDHADPGLRAQLQANPTALVAYVRDQLLRRTLLAQAHAAKWDERPEIIARANDAHDAVIEQTYVASRIPIDPMYPSQAEIAAAYEANKERFAVPKMFHLAQIAILVPSGAAKDVDEAARRKIDDLRQQGMKPMEDFGALASRNSQDKSTAEHGGDLGWVREDALVPGLHDAVVKLSDGGITPPLHSAVGWYIVKLYASRPAAVAPLDQVRDTLIQAMRQARAQQSTRTYLENLERQDPITISSEADLAAKVSTAH